MVLTRSQSKLLQSSVGVTGNTSVSGSTTTSVSSSTTTSVSDSTTTSVSGVSGSTRPCVSSHGSTRPCISVSTMPPCISVSTRPSISVSTMPCVSIHGSTNQHAGSSVNASDNNGNPHTNRQRAFSRQQREFVDNIKRMLDLQKTEHNKTEKMKNCLKIFEYNNEMLHNFQHDELFRPYFKSVHDKCLVLEREHEHGDYDEQPHELVCEFMKNVKKCKKNTEMMMPSQQQP